MASRQRVTLKDIPLESSLSSQIPPESGRAVMSGRSWTIIRVSGAVILVLGLGLVSNMLEPSMTGAISAATGTVEPGMIAGILGLALVATIALSSVIDHD